MKAITEFESLYVHRAPVDLRKNIHGLAAIVETEMKLSLRSPSLFIFANSRRNLIKMIYFDRSGFALWLKRLDEAKFPWPKKIDDEVQAIAVSAEDLKLVLDGVNIWTRFEEVCFEQLV